MGVQDDINAFMQWHASLPQAQKDAFAQYVQGTQQQAATPAAGGPITGGRFGQPLPGREGVNGPAPIKSGPIGIPEVQGPATPDNQWYNDPTGQGMGQRPEDRPGMTMPNRVTPDLGFDPYYEEQIRNLDQQGLEAQSQGDLSVQRLKQMLDTTTSRLGTMRQQDESQLMDRMAGQGILRSGITAGEQGKIGEQYTNTLADVNAQAATQQDDIRRAVADQLQKVNSGKSQLRTDQARAKSSAQMQADQANAMADAQYQALLAQQPAPNPVGQYQVKPFNLGPAIQRRIGV